jgi:hypothetical protein
MCKPVYFDQTPSGRIINKFSADLGMMDTMLNQSFADMAYGIFNFCNLFITISV